MVVIKLKDDGSVASIEPFMTGFLENNNYNGRPVDVLVLKDGSLLVSDDWNGAVWRVTYGNNGCFEGPAGRPASRHDRSIACAPRSAVASVVRHDRAPPGIAQTVADRLPVCLACHGDTGVSANPDTPSLGGEPAGYLLVQLYLFREKQRHSEIMIAMTSGLTDDDLRTLSDASPNWHHRR